MPKQRVIFLCTHNSARSQMAEGLLRAWAGDRFEVLSAGTERTRVRPEAISVMREIGIDIGHHRSKTLDESLEQRFDWVVTVCDEAREACPTLPGVVNQAHWSIDDPASASGTDAERLVTFRRARDELAERVRGFIAKTAGNVTPAAELSRPAGATERLSSSR